MAVTDSSPFSLLLPVYTGDRPDFLTAAFLSTVNEQTRPPDEVVMVQDGPLGPALAAAVRNLSSQSPVPVTVIALPANVGLARALDQGLAACQHDTVARMDADDLSLPTRFERQLAMVVAGLDLVGTGMLEFTQDEAGTIVNGRRRIPPTDPAEIRRYARFADPFNHPTVMYSKAAVQRAGGYQPLGLMEDYWLFVRMLANGARVGNLPDPLLQYRISSGAYARRGGWELLRSEALLQREFRRSGFTNNRQFLRNLALRGGYRLVPEAIRKPFYRRFVMRRNDR